MLYKSSGAFKRARLCRVSLQWSQNKGKVEWLSSRSLTSFKHRYTQLRPVQTHSTLYTIQHSTCILYKVECVWTPCIVPTIHDSTSLIVYSDVWNWSNFYSTTTRLFLCFAITEAILYKVELVWTFERVYSAFEQALTTLSFAEAHYGKLLNNIGFGRARGERPKNFTVKAAGNKPLRRREA